MSYAKAHTFDIPLIDRCTALLTPSHTMINSLHIVWKSVFNFEMNIIHHMFCIMCWSVQTETNKPMELQIILQCRFFVLCADGHFHLYISGL